MKRPLVLAHEFVKTVPNDLKERTLYVSVDYATIVHKCCCGCGGEVVTPLTPTDWKLIYDGVSISLNPSIGNWSFGCQSHYWISKSTVRWARQWSSRRIDAGRARDRRLKEGYHRDREIALQRTEDPARKGMIKRLWTWLCNVGRP